MAHLDGIHYGKTPLVEPKFHAMDNTNMVVQHRLFAEVKKIIGASDYVSELSDLLDLSQDSIYRRLRGETLLNIIEIQKLLIEYDLSLDDFLDTSVRRVSFSFQPIRDGGFTFVEYLSYIERMMRRVVENEHPHMLYLAKDIPLFHLMNAPALAAFKLFFWRKTILDFKSYRRKKFSFQERDERVNDLSRKIRAHYYKVSSTEIYSPETIDTTLNEVLYYAHAGLFEDLNDALVVLDSLEQLVLHLKAQCEEEYRFKLVKSGEDNSESSVRDPRVDYKVLYNEILFTDATVLVKLDHEKWSYLTNNGLNILATRDENFYDQCFESFDVISKRSTLISGNSEKERSQIFNRYASRIRMVRKRLENEIEQDL